VDVIGLSPPPANTTSDLNKAVPAMRVSIRRRVGFETVMNCRDIICDLLIAVVPLPFTEKSRRTLAVSRLSDILIT
jgi:hypothetical protein